MRYSLISEWNIEMKVTARRHMFVPDMPENILWHIKPRNATFNAEVCFPGCINKHID